MRRLLGAHIEEGPASQFKWKNNTDYGFIYLKRKNEFTRTKQNTILMLGKA